MKTIYINEIKPGTGVDDVFILSEKIMSQKKNGGSFLRMTLTDKTGNVKCVAWDNVDEIASSAVTGDYVMVSGSVSEYQGTPQIVIKSMKAVPPEEINPGDFMPTTTRNVDAMFQRLVNITEGMKNTHLKVLLRAFWDDEPFVKKFKTAPAAKKMHHDYLGGLLEHTLSMALLVERIGGHYKGVDMDMLLAGAVLHDIGKVREFDYRTVIDYSDEGRLLGHIIIGLRMVEEKIAGLKDFPRETEMLIRHMIVSHHGTREFGSPELPKTVEAMLLNHIDDIDAKVNGIRSFVEQDPPDGNWTRFHRLYGRQFYKGAF